MFARSGRLLWNFSKPVRNFFGSLSSKPIKRNSLAINFLPASSVSSFSESLQRAEKVVNYSTRDLNLQCLTSEEFSQIVALLQKLNGLSHPVVETARKLISEDDRYIQFTGLIILLVAKAAGVIESCAENDSLDGTVGLTQRQRRLAELAEMINMARLIHFGVLDSAEDSELQTGNKLATLSGDYFLAKACAALSDLRSPKVVEMISEAIGDFTVSEFLCQYNDSNNPIPTKDLTLETWSQQRFLSDASLIARSCQGALLFSGQSEEIQKKGFEVGRNMGLALSVFNDLQLFVNKERYPKGTSFSLLSAPVFFHYLTNPQSLTELISAPILDYAQIFNTIMNGKGIIESKAFLWQLAQKTAKELDGFEKNDACESLAQIAFALCE